MPSEEKTPIAFFILSFISSGNFSYALKPEEKQSVIDEAKQILDVRDVIASIILVDDLRIQKD